MSFFFFRQDLGNFENLATFTSEIPGLVFDILSHLHLTWIPVKIEFSFHWSLLRFKFYRNFHSFPKIKFVKCLLWLQSCYYLNPSTLSCLISSSPAHILLLLSETDIFVVMKLTKYKFLKMYKLLLFIWNETASLQKL